MQCPKLILGHQLNLVILLLFTSFLIHLGVHHTQSHRALPMAPSKQKKVGEVKLSFVEYSARKKVHLHPDILECPRGGPQPLYDLIIGKKPLHDIGAMLDFKEKTITIDEILLPMRNINNLQLKPSISRVLKFNSSFAQEPISTRNATKRIVEILDAKYDNADLPSIFKNNWVHLSTPHQNLLLTLLLKFKELFDGMLQD